MNRQVTPRGKQLWTFAMGVACTALAGCSDPGVIASDGHTGNDPTGGSTGGTLVQHPEANQGTPSSTSTPGSPSPGASAKCSVSPKKYGTLGLTVCIPSGMEGRTDPKPAGLVVALHGYTQGVESKGDGSAEWGYMPTTEWAKLAEKHRFYVIFPDKGTQSFSWYAFFGASGIGRSDLEPTSIVQMVKDMQAAHNIDASKVFVNGLSAGAFMSVVMLATYPDVFSAGATFAGGAYGCSTQCAALGKKGQGGWTWPGNHASSLVTQAFPQVWSNAGAEKPRLMIFQGDSDGAVTPENMADLTQQWAGAVGVAGAGTKSNLKGHELTEYTKNGKTMLATVLMKGIGHGTPVDPGTGPDQGGWDPEPSKTMKSDQNATQDWTNSAGVYGPYYAAKFFGLIQ